MNYLTNILFALIRTVLCGQPLSEELKSEITPKILENLYYLSNNHDIAHIVSEALYKNGLLCKNEIYSEKFKLNQIVAFARCTQLEYEKKRIYDTLENNKINFIPLKGAIIRDYYTEPYMRTSCDIDILVREENLDRAVEVLSSMLNYTAESKGYHDISLFSPNGVHLELHFNILEKTDKLDIVLKRAWDYAIPKTKYCFEFCPEFFMFHIMAHITYHFKHGGCGIRSFIDLYILHKNFKFDYELFKNLCRECNIFDFYEKCMDLISVWFGKNHHDNTTLAIQNYVISGGTYGSLKNKLACEQKIDSSKIRYFINRIFLKKADLVILYPKLNKNSLLLPYYQLKRWYSCVKLQKSNRIFKEIKTNFSLSNQSINKVSELMKELHLDF